MRYKYLVLTVFLLVIYSCKETKSDELKTPKLELESLKHIADVEERYQSVNVEMCEVVGGEFWIPYDLIDTAAVKARGFSALKRKIPAIDLYDEKLRMLTSALGPMYIRVSGTWANTTYFQDNDLPKMTKAPDGYENVLTQKEWKGVIDFCQYLDAKLVTSFAISDGMRDQKGNWTNAQVKPLLEYTNILNGEIYASEMFNEPSHSSHGGAPENYDAIDYANDFKAFKEYISVAAPDMKILGPGSTGEGGILGGNDSTITTDKILSANPMPEFDIFSYHFYGGVSQRCMGQLSPENALNDEWLSKTEDGLKFYEEARDTYLPDAPIWLTETAEAACGGNPWAVTFLDTFRYLEQMGRLAKKGVQVVMHNTLAASEYALLEQDTHDPRPNYWAALLWGRLMGTQVFDLTNTIEGLNVYIHNLKGVDNGYAALLINPSEKAVDFHLTENAEQYLLTAKELVSKEIQLNGKVLKLESDTTMPDIKGVSVSKGELSVPAHSIMFLTFQGK